MKVEHIALHKNIMDKTWREKKQERQNTNNLNGNKKEKFSPDTMKAEHIALHKKTKTKIQTKNGNIKMQK